MDPDDKGLQNQIERLTRENTKLRTELIVMRLWNPPAELERAFQDASGWTCLPVPPTEDGPAPTLILVAGSAPGAEPLDPEAAGRVWRYLLTAAPIRGRIGPFARASMPAHLLGYLGEQDGREVIVLNTDLTRSQLTCAARSLWSAAKGRRPSPRLLLMSVAPPPIMYALLRAGGAQGVLALVVPAAVIAASVALAPGHVPADTRLGPVPRGPSWGRDHVERPATGRPPSSTGAPKGPGPFRSAAPTGRSSRPSGTARTSTPGRSTMPPAESPGVGGTPSPSPRPSPVESPSPSPSSAAPPSEQASPSAQE